jgi:hypothetical protein
MLQKCKNYIFHIKRFFQYLFRPASKEEKDQFQKGLLEESELFYIKEKDLKNLFEKFCFLNHYTPKTLTNSKVKFIKFSLGSITFANFWLLDN